jgi:2'-5' RNA ligase
MLAIFIEPNGELRKFIIKWKLRIKKNYLNTKFVDHPPHSTIFLANLIKQKIVIKEIQKIADNLPSFKIEINKTNIFLNDEFTNKDTIFLNIKKNINIALLQRKIAEKLKNLVKKKNINQKFLNKQLNDSQLKYGFPFVGSHWKPHFTIGSIKNFKGKTDYNVFMKKKISFEINIKTISLWKISGNKHKRIKNFNLVK